ncbi:hypothetical protein HDZ31DRAFT_82417 [Schizophyllum fasciatum]
MFAPILALLSGVALANAYGLKSVSTTSSDQFTGNWDLQKTAYGALLVGGKDVPLTTSVIIEGGKLKLVCPAASMEVAAAFIPTGKDAPKYTVQFVSKTDDLPEGSIFEGWTTQDDGVPMPDGLTKVVNTDVGLDGSYGLAPIDGANALTWSAKGNGAQWFMAIDETEDVHCTQ